MRALRVLIIEDQPLIALLFEEVLSEMGHDVCARECTQAGAIAAAARCQPELIIADVALQEGSGIDAMKCIMATGFIPHLFISGSLLNRSTLNPAAGVLQKPFSDRWLIKAIEHAIAPETVLIGENYEKTRRQS